jgi:hypothetical protein
MDLDLNPNSILNTSVLMHLEGLSPTTQDLMANTGSSTNIWHDSLSLDEPDLFVPQFITSSALIGFNTTSKNTLPNSDWLLWPNRSTREIPPLARNSMQTLLRVIKTWPRMLAKGFQHPAMLHHSHINPKTILQPMQNCIVVAKLWSSQTVRNADSVRDVILHNMRLLLSTYQALDERQLLAALQALTMYTIMLMYPAYMQMSVSLVDPSIFLCLQKVVSHVARTGLMLTQERDNVRPSWQAWVHVTSKRRAVFSLYLLHWSYAVYHDLPSFECSQLGFMPAPAPKFLWQSSSQAEWQDMYNRWAAQWEGIPYMMYEFAGVQAGTSLDRRTEIWLEDADELGIMFFSIGKSFHLVRSGGDLGISC